MEFGSFGGRYDSEQSIVGLAKKPKIFVMEDNLFSVAVPFDTI